MIARFEQKQKLLSIIDQLYDEIIIYDNSYQIVYVNQACFRHYGLTPENMIGKSFFNFTNNNCWDNSILPVVYKTQKAWATKQKTKLGCELFTIAVPIFDEENQLAYVAMSVRDEVTGIKLYNPDYTSQKPHINHASAPVAVSNKMKDVLALAKKISTVDVTCILTGESGTGKTMLAKYIHANSDRHNKKFISLNCASIPENLLESELFGYAKGAFTGANSKGKSGLFAAADQGTLFLDEIGEMPLAAQAKLLHVLQEKTYYPVGSTVAHQTNARILAATNRNLEEMIEKGLFREDLYYRLNIVEIRIPALRERPEDIPPLCLHFQNYYNKKYGFDKYFTSQALSVLYNAEWNGNIRELQHMIERMIVTSDGREIDIQQLPESLTKQSEKSATAFSVLADREEKAEPLDVQLAKYESALVCKAYEVCGSSRKLASYFDISQTRANNLIRKYVQKESG